MKVYLDYNASTPVDPRLWVKIKPFFSRTYGNPSSLHAAGQRAKAAVERARKNVSDVLKVEPEDILFTSGATEANNLALAGTWKSIGPKRNHMLISSIEHVSVMDAVMVLKREGVIVDMAPVNKSGVVDMDFIKDKVGDRTAMVSLMHVNNETGTIQPIEEAARLAHQKGALFHTDAVQSFGKTALYPEEQMIDFASISSHKIYGPKGAGALYVRKGVDLQGLMYGGHQERGLKPGTENVPSLVGFGEAAQLIDPERSESKAERQRILGLKKKLYQGLSECISGIHLNGDLANGVYNTLNISFEGIDGETLLVNLDLKGIQVSAGSACQSGALEASHVLTAMGLPEKLARASVRFSLGRFTKDKEIEHVLRVLPAVIDRMRKASVC